MNTLLKIALSLIFCGSISAEPLNQFLDFYVGADIQARRMKFKEGFGDNLLHKTHPQGNIYAGFKINENMAVEIGHESTITRTCESTLMAGECSAGTLISNIIEPVFFKTKIKIKGPHFDFVGFYPLHNYPIQFIGSLGISSHKATVERKTNMFGNPSIPSGTVRTLLKHNIALRCMGGAQYLTDYGLGFRGTITFVKTRNIVIKKNDNHPSLIIPTIKAKDSIVYGIGGFYNF